MKQYTINDLISLGAKRDGLEQAKAVIEQELARVNQQLDEVSEQVALQMPEELEYVAVPELEDNYPGINEIDEAA